MTQELEDWQLALLVEARRLDDPTVVEANAAEDLQRAQDLLAQADDVDQPVVIEHETAKTIDDAEALLDASKGLDDWEVVDAETRAAELEALEEVSDTLSDALQEHFSLREDVVEAMSVPAMVSQFRDEEDGEFSLESLSQHPETGGADADDVDDDDTDDGGDVDSLSASERRTVEEKLSKAEKMESRTPDYADALRGEAAEIVGVESADDIDMEAL